jgi:cytidyltransferase-like protein
MIVGYAYVVGDILHTGHLLHLRNCKALCDKLIVGVLTDEATMEKKPRPAMPFAGRIQMVGAIQWVDAAVTQATYLPLENILEIQPDVLFECAQHEKRTHDDYPGFTGRIIAMPYYPGCSSTQIKEKIRET